MWFFFPFKWMCTRFNCSAEANGTFWNFVSLPALWVPLIQWVGFDTNTNAQILKCMLFLQKEKPVFGDCFAWFATDHTFENAIDAPSFLSVVFAPLPAHWVTWATSPAICLNPRIMSRIQRWHVNTSHRPCSALRSLYKHRLFHIPSLERFPNPQNNFMEEEQEQQENPPITLLFSLHGYHVEFQYIGIGWNSLRLRLENTSRVVKEITGEISILGEASVWLGACHCPSPWWSQVGLVTPSA